MSRQVADSKERERYGYAPEELQLLVHRLVTSVRESRGSAKNIKIPTCAQVLTRALNGGSFDVQKWKDRTAMSITPEIANILHDNTASRS